MPSVTRRLGSEEAGLLRNELYDISELEERRIRVDGTEYELKVEIFDSFEEKIFTKVSKNKLFREILFFYLIYKQPVIMPYIQPAVTDHRVSPVRTFASFGNLEAADYF